MAVPRKRKLRHSFHLHILEEGNSKAKQNNVSSQMMNSNQLPMFGGGRNFIQAKFVPLFLFGLYMGSCILFIPSILIIYNQDVMSDAIVRSLSMNNIRERRLMPLTTTDDELFLDDTDDDEYFSACILWMDDNHRLEEWLAYHYYFLKLRYVVINVDPRSTTTPQAIVDRWNGNNKVYKNNSKEILDYNLNMTIVLWNDTVYTDPTKYEIEQSVIAFAKGDKKYQAATEYHKLRQPAFYKACTRHLIAEREKDYQQQYNEKSTAKNKEHKRPSQWTAYFDTDEFFSFKPETIRAKNRSKYEAPGYVLKKINLLKERKIQQEELKKDGTFLQEQQGREEKMAKDIEQRLRMELSLNTLSESERKSKNRILQQLRAKKANVVETSTDSPTSPASSGLSCLVIPRNGIASTELTEQETNELLDATHASEPLIPQEFVHEKLFLEKSHAEDGRDTTSADGRTILRRFDTLRYNYHATGMSTYGKSILDLSQSDVQEAAKQSFPFRTHGVISSVCQKKSYNTKVFGNQQTENYSIVHKEKMQLNHYVGSWESYNARPNDARKGLSDSSAKFTENSKSYQNWLQKSKTLSGQESTVIRPWLKGFIRLVGGPKVAAHLLQDAGILFPAKDAGMPATREIDELSF